MEQYDLKVCRHDSNDRINEDTDIYIVNSYGETKSFYKICKTVFLGGSLIQHGGQNPLEPAIYGCKTLHGPNIWNFKEIYSLLHKNKISKKIKNSREIAKEINNIFNNKNNSQKLKSKIIRLGETILNKTLKEINLFITKNEF